MGEKAADKDHGFTLIELLVAVLISGLLLAGLAMTMHQLGQSSAVSPWEHESARYARVVDVIDADIRGLIQIEPVVPEQSEHGRAVAVFVTTHRIDALDEQGWRSAARVSYWLEETAEGGQRLWRREETLRSDDDNPSWTVLLGRLDRLQFECLIEDKWKPWPRHGEGDEGENADAAVYAAVRMRGATAEGVRKALGIAGACAASHGWSPERGGPLMRAYRHLRSHQRGLVLLMTLLMTAILAAMTATMAYAVSAQNLASGAQVAAHQNRCSMEAALEVIDARWASGGLRETLIREGESTGEIQVGQAHVTYRIWDEATKLSYQRTSDENASAMLEGVALRPIEANEPAGSSKQQAYLFEDVFQVPLEDLKAFYGTPANGKALLDRITLWTDGRVNVHTADEQVLRARFADMGTSVAESVVTLKAIATCTIWIAWCRCWDWKSVRRVRCD